MTTRTELTAVSKVHQDRSYLFTVTDQHNVEEEIIVVPCEDETTDDTPDEITEDETTENDTDLPVQAYVNRCTHEPQRLDTGRGVAMRDGQIICPRHGSMFDACSGYCDNGDAKDTTLPDVDIAVEDGTVYLTDDDYAFEHEGGIDAGEDDGPSSTSHIGF